MIFFLKLSKNGEAAGVSKKIKLRVESVKKKTNRTRKLSW